MTKQQFDDLYLGKAVHCDTEEKANKFLELAHSVGWEWCSGESLLKRSSYHHYQEQTCYRVDIDGFEYCYKSFYIEEGYEVVEFKQEKENNMKYKVGDKVRVRSDLVVDKRYGCDVFVHGMLSFKGVEGTIKIVGDEIYQIEEDNGMWNWTAEMLEPVEETFNVGDVVYDTVRKRNVEIVEKAWVIKYDGNWMGFRRESKLSKTNPLKKITREELAEMGYDLVD